MTRLSRDKYAARLNFGLEFKKNVDFTSPESAPFRLPKNAAPLTQIVHASKSCEFEQIHYR
jgi:hypothetical protein